MSATCPSPPPTITAINRKNRRRPHGRTRPPAIGFVNEERLYKTGEADARIATLNCLARRRPATSATTPSATPRSTRSSSRTGRTTSSSGRDRHPPAPRRPTRQRPSATSGSPTSTPAPTSAPAAPLKRSSSAAAIASPPSPSTPRDWYFADLYDDARTRTPIQPPPRPRLADRLARLHRRGRHPRRAPISRTLARLRAQSRPSSCTPPALEADHLPDLLSPPFRGRGYTFLSLAERPRRPRLRPARHLHLRRRRHLARPLGRHPRAARALLRQTSAPRLDPAKTRGPLPRRQQLTSPYRCAPAPSSSFTTTPPFITIRHAPAPPRAASGSAVTATRSA